MKNIDEKIKAIKFIALCSILFIITAILLYPIVDWALQYYCFKN